MNRRGELSMEVIIIAAIALLVLVILTILLMNSGSGVKAGTSCAGGTCKQGTTCAANEEESKGGSVLCGKDQICCVSIDPVKN